MHSVKNNTFTTLVKEFKPEGQEYVLPNMTLRKGTDGKLYLFASILEPAGMQIFRYDEDAKEYFDQKDADNAFMEICYIESTPHRKGILR